MNCKEHMFKNTPIILNQRYCNHSAKRMEALLEVQGNYAVTDCQRVHLDYFRDVYTLAKYGKQGEGNAA